jgi:hypothetical protein
VKAKKNEELAKELEKEKTMMEGSTLNFDKMEVKLKFDLDNSPESLKNSSSPRNKDNNRMTKYEDSFGNTLRNVTMKILTNIESITPFFHKYICYNNKKKFPPEVIFFFLITSRGR